MVKLQLNNLKKLLHIGSSEVYIFTKIFAFSAISGVCTGTAKTYQYS